MTTPKTLEIVGPTIDDAIKMGLEQLGLTDADIDFEILDAGNKGIFGLGTRQARVKIIVREEETEDFAAALEQHEAAEDIVTSGVTLDRDALSVEDESALDVAESVLTALLEKMGVVAEIKAGMLAPKEDGEPGTISLDIQGKDLSFLIGKRSESLNALQYITSLIVGKELGKWTPVLLDVQGYRARREKQLRQLANRMADQALATGRRQTLEPMPANERRLIHMELREHPGVITQSIGEEPNRKVTIVVKE